MVSRLTSVSEALGISACKARGRAGVACRAKSESAREPVKTVGEREKAGWRSKGKTGVMP